MKSPLPLIILNIIFSLLNKSHAQNIVEQKNKIQFEYGLAYAHNYNAPISFFFCIEGCTTLSQAASITGNAGVNYYRSINDRHEVEIGFGLSRFKTNSTLKGLEYGNIYDQELEFKYYNFSIGHRYKLNLTKKLRPYIENNFLYEQLRKENYYLHTPGFALKTRIGLYFVHNNKINFNADAFFKSGLNKYNSIYTPFYFGLDTGMSFVF